MADGLQLGGAGKNRRRAEARPSTHQSDANSQGDGSNIIRRGHARYLTIGRGWFKPHRMRVESFGSETRYTLSLHGFNELNDWNGLNYLVRLRSLVRAADMGGKDAGGRPEIPRG